jgi:hypothetical protein
MSWMIVAAAGLSAAGKGASQSSANANQGQDKTGGGLGMASQALGAVAGKMGDPNAIPSSSGGTIEQPLYDGKPAQTPYSFYGGESAGQLKSASKLKVVGGVNPDRTSKGDVFYSNVHIPRKKV